MEHVGIAIVVAFVVLYLLVGLVRCHRLSYLPRKLTRREEGRWRGFWINARRTAYHAPFWPTHTL